MATYTVTNINDSGTGSLRQQIINASTGDTVQFAAGISGGTIVLTSGSLALTKDLVIDGDIDGDNKADVTISGNDASRIFNISGVTTDIDLLSLTLTNGSGSAIFAGLYTSLEIFDSTITNSAGFRGGGVAAVGTTFVRIANSLLTGNSASDNGGGVYFGSSFYNGSFVGVSATITNSTISGNESNSGGGGIYVSTESNLTLNNSTISENLADADGTSANFGGGIFIANPLFKTINNSVVAQNYSGGMRVGGPVSDDVRGTINSASNSFFGTYETISSGSGNINNGGDPLLAALADNGGTVQTQDILAGSQLLNAGNNASIPAGITTDANGNARIASTTVDIGATEFVPVVNTVLDEAADGGTLAADMLDGQGLSLRELLAYAGEGDIATFDAALAGQTITLTHGELALTQDITINGDIDGDDKADITISGNDASRIFNITGASTDATIQSLFLTNGSTVSDGGAIKTSSINTLTVINSTIANSYAGGTGGGLYLLDATYIVNSLIHDNFANGAGGGIYVGNGSVEITNSTIYGNVSNSDGGGVYIISTVDFFSSTITGNLADADGNGTNYGGGIYNGGVLNTTNSVIANNSSESNGGGPGDIRGGVDNANNNFFGANVVISSGVNNINGGGDPLLLALADNGGTVQTILARVDSQLIGAGDSAFLPADVHDLDGDGDVAENLPVDANGNARVQGVLDIGAVEVADDLPWLVDNITDENDGDFSVGDLSLREVISLAGAGDTIAFDAALAGQTIVLSMGELALIQDITIEGDIDGDDKADITISGNSTFRIFNISGAATDVELHSLNITSGYGNTQGGAILANGGATLTVVNSTISGSSSHYGGGGLYLGGATGHLVNTLVHGNYAESIGGGIGVGGGSLTLTNSTITQNFNFAGGGGIALLGSTLVANNSTIVGNQANVGVSSGTFGGGIYEVAGSNVTLNNTVVAENVSSLAAIADDIRGTIASASSSFIGTTETITVGIGNQNGAGDPLMGELLDNGGATLTLSPLDGSPLIGAGSNIAVPADIHDIDGDGNTAEPLPLDGRGGVRIVGGTVDIGAVEQIVDETIGGTADDDNIVGGLGNDTATYKDAAAGVTQYLLFTGLDTGGAGTDALSGIENLTGSEFVDRLAGDGNDNILSGNGGDDILKGKGGNDTFHGGGGNDKIVGGAEDDTMFGGDGNDTLIALAGLDTLNGEDGDDFLFGGQDSDVLNGGAGDDNIRGNLGVDVLNGGTGSDTLRGGGSNDTLNGGADNDFLFGENHVDVIDGGAGNDSLTGGLGGGAFDGFTDTFVYKDTADGGGGFDRIKDFENGIDAMDLQSFGFADFAAVQALASNSGPGLRIDFGAGDVLFVENFQLADFDVGDVLI